VKVRYICHAGIETGYGRAATDLALALVEAGVDLDLVPLSTPWAFSGRAAVLAKHVECSWPLHGDREADVTIVHTMPMDCPKVHEDVAESGETGAGPWIAYTTWEGVDLPSRVGDPLYRDGSDGLSFDEVWVPSSATQDSFLNAGDASYSTFVLPHTFQPDDQPIARRSDEDVFRFVYIGAWTTRKNPHGLIRAFAATFAPADHVELVIHSPGVSVEMFTAALVATGLEQADMPRVRLSAERLSDDVMRQMHHQYDCFVTATRGEAWNLPAFEAMLAGRMVIAPGGMGHDDFLFEDPDVLAIGGEETSTSARRVASFQQPAFVDVRTAEPSPLFGKSTLVFTTVGAQGLSCRTSWRDPDLGHLGYQMRSVYEKRERDIRIDYDPASRFGHKVVAEKAISRMEHLIAKGRSR
jgi:hypothetical protein